MKIKRGFIKAQEDDSKKLNPKLAVGEVIYISVNGGENGLNTEGFVENIFRKQLDLDSYLLLQTAGQLTLLHSVLHLISKEQNPRGSGL